MTEAYNAGWEYANNGGDDVVTESRVQYSEGDLQNAFAAGFDAWYAGENN